MRMSLSTGVMGIAWLLFVFSAQVKGLLPQVLGDEKVIEDRRSIDTLVVCPKDFQEELQPWIKFREEQGYKIGVIPPAYPRTLRKKIREIANKHPVKSLLLVGDGFSDEPRSDHQLSYVPRGLVEAKINVKFRSESLICTDNAYADLDDDKIPELAVGRLTVDNNRELKEIIDKIIRYETGPQAGVWRRKINLVAGIGGFGGMSDRIVEAAAKQLILKGIPGNYQTSITYANWRSPYCPDPRRFHDATLKTLNEGSLFWVYFGHGHPYRLDHVKTPVAKFKILNIQDREKLVSENGSPIAIMLACYTGAFDATEDCLAEEMLKASRGPVAVFAGSRVTMPYGMSVLSYEMMHELFEGDSKTLGDLILKSKQQTALRKTEDFDEIRMAIDSLATFFGPNPDLKAERLEHLDLFNLLGDPLLKLPKPKKIAIAAPKESGAGKLLKFVASCPISGKLTFDLCQDRSCLPFDRPKRSDFEWSYEFLNRLQTDYQSANNRVIWQKSVDVKKGQIELELRIPENASGLYHVRGFIENRQVFALGEAPIEIK